MKKAILFSAAALLALCTLPTAYAQCGGVKVKGEVKAARLDGDRSGCSKEAKAACGKDGQAGCDKTAACCGKDGCKESGCQVRALAAAGAPLMTYKVGDDCVRCPEKAAALAKQKSAEVRYVVGDKTYTNKDEAVKAYAAALDDYVATMTSVRYAVGDDCVACPRAAAELARKSNSNIQYRVAAMTFDSETKAEAAAKAARLAVEKVALKAEGRNDCARSCGSRDAAKACNERNARTAKAAGCGTIGDGCCPETHAALSLALARIEAAQRAIADAAGTQTTAASDSANSGA